MNEEILDKRYNMTSYIGETKMTFFMYPISLYALHLKIVIAELVMKTFLIALETLCFISLSDQVNAEMRSKCQILFSPQMSNSSESFRRHIWR